MPPTETLPAITCIARLSLADTRTLSPAETIAPEPIDASVVIEYTEMPPLTVTAAVPPRPALAAIESTLSLELASSVTEPLVALAVTVVPEPIALIVFLEMTWTSTPAPTPASPPIAIEPAVSVELVVSFDEIATLPLLETAEPPLLLATQLPLTSSPT